MGIHLLQYIAIIADIVLSTAVAVIFRSGTRKYIWRLVSDYAIAKVIGEAIMLAMLLSASRVSPQVFSTCYFVAFYGTFVALTALTLRLYYQIYIRATAPFEGFAKWGKSLFALVVLVMVIMTLMTFGQINAGSDLMARAGINFMRAANTVDFCVVAFLCYLIRTMGMPMRSKVFGMMLGFVFGNLAGFLQMLFMQFNIEPGIAISTIIEFSGALTCIIWTVYAFLPEPMPRPVTLPAESPVYRWSQIAASLGTKTQVAVPEPQHSFFLADVELVVDKVFARHMQESTDSNS